MVLNLSWSKRPMHICIVCVLQWLHYGSGACWFLVMQSTWSGAYFKVYVLQCHLYGSGAFWFPLVQFHMVLVQIKLRDVVD